MVSPGTRAWIDINMAESKLFETSEPTDLTASLFVNEVTYLVLANYGEQEQAVGTCGQWQDRESGRRGQKWTIPGRKLVLLQRVDGHSKV